MATETTSGGGFGGERIREFIDDHRWYAYFVLVEVILVGLALLFDSVTLTFEQGGAIYSHVLAGLLGGWAVVVALLGLLGIAFSLLTRVWFRFSRE